MFCVATMNKRTHLLLQKTISYSSWLSLALLVIVLDRASKVLSLAHLTYGEPLAVFPGFNLTLSYNRGAAFSFLSEHSGWQQGLFVGIALLVSLVILVWLWRASTKRFWFCLGLALILGGALSNCWDRIFYGYVVDYVSLYFKQWHFAIFNVADSAITVGAVILIVDSFRSTDA